MLDEMIPGIRLPGPTGRDRAGRLLLVTAGRPGFEVQAIEVAEWPPAALKMPILGSGPLPAALIHLALRAKATPAREPERCYLSVTCVAMLSFEGRKARYAGDGWIVTHAH
jgi:hypothetical protein